MKTNRICVIGASGSGTSTVGGRLASTLSLPHFECDDYFHGPGDPPFQNPRSAKERHRLILRDLAPTASWVLSGGIVGWEPRPELDFTCLVFLYVPTAVRVERLRLRERARFGNRIEQEGDMHDIHQDFIEWASRYDAGDIEGKTLALHEAYLKEHRCPVLEFRGELAVSEIVESVIQSLVRAGSCTLRNARI